MTTCGKYPCVYVMPERYLVFTCCSANARISARTRKRKNFDSCACAYACVKAVFTMKYYCVRACTYACVANENQSLAITYSYRASNFLGRSNFILL